MKVSELKQLVPLADVFELREGMRYLVQLPRHLSIDAIENYSHSLKVAGLTNVLLCDGNVTFYELPETPKPRRKKTDAEINREEPIDD